MSMTSLMSRWRQRWQERPPGLGPRILAIFLALILVMQVVSFAVIDEVIDRVVRSSLESDLVRGEETAQQFLTLSADGLKSKGSVLATDYGFREAVLSSHEDTIVSALETLKERIGGTFAALLDPELRVVALTEARVGPPMDITEKAQRIVEGQLGHLVSRHPLPPDAQTGGSGTPREVVHQMVLVPVRAPNLVGYVMFAVPIEATLTTLLEKLNAIELRFPSMGEMIRPDPHYAERTISDTTGKQAADVRIVLRRSIDEAKLPYEVLQRTLLVVTLLAFAVGAWVTTSTARRISRPLEALTLAAERIGAQADYRTPVDIPERRDEVGRLAIALEHMRVQVLERDEVLSHRAYVDTLTGLASRHALAEATATALGPDKEAPRPAALLMLELDRVKEINESLGYALGDRVLMEVARLLREMLEGSAHADATVCRVDGAKFAVLLPGGDAAAALRFGLALQTRFEMPLLADGHVIDLSAGIGYACSPADAASAELLLSRATIAVQEASLLGAGLPPLAYDPRFDESSPQTLRLLSEMRDALRRDELRLFLQPKVRVDDLSLHGAEALVRWEHPERGLVPPMQFIPHAERTGFIRQLTLWVIDEAARQWHQLNSMGIPLTISVNLSTKDMLNPTLLEDISLRLDKHRAAPENFCLEITESAMMKDPQGTQMLLRSLRAKGFRLSIDDFGTGFSSLAYLKHLPVQELKIDKSFVMGMVSANAEEAEADAKIVDATIMLAKSLGKQVVAEGVENAQVVARLRDMGCDQAQGYHIGKPMPVQSFITWAQGWVVAHPGEPEVAGSDAPVAGASRG